MTLHDPNLIRWLGLPEDDIFGGSALAIPGWINSAAQVALFIVLTLRLITSLLRDLHPQPARMEAT
jgi:TRAP-type C4-dicarboxylate transport system permease small subunit